MRGFIGILAVVYLFHHAEAVSFTSPGTAATGGTVTATGVAETSTAGAPLFTVTATGGTAGYTYAFETSGNPDSVAAIDTATGAVTLATSKSIDYETTKQLVFVVSATDSAGTPVKATMTVTLPIKNRLEFAKAKYGVCATDGATGGTAIATYTVADAATGDTVAYTVTVTDLAVAQTTGALTVATGVTLSQATTGGYTVTITATATGTDPSAPGTTEVWVAICSTTCSGVGQVTAVIGVLLLGLLASCKI